MSLQEINDKTPISHTTNISHVFPTWWYIEKQDSPRELLEIIYRSQMLLLSGNRKLCGKLTIIRIQHLHWIIITTGWNHHDPNHEGCANHQHNQPKLDPFGHMINHHIYQEQIFVWNIQLFYEGEGIRSFKNVWHQDYDNTKTLKMLPFKYFKWAIPREHTLICCSVVRVQDHHRHIIGTIHQCTFDDGTMIMFNQRVSGLYYYEKTNEAFDWGQNMDYTFISTV